MKRNIVLKMITSAWLAFALANKWASISRRSIVTNINYIVYQKKETLNYKFRDTTIILVTNVYRERFINSKIIF